MPLPGKPMYNDVRYACELFCILQGTLYGCIGHRVTEMCLILLAKCVLEATSSMGANYPHVHY